MVVLECLPQVWSHMIMPLSFVSRVSKSKVDWRLPPLSIMARFTNVTIIIIIPLFRTAMGSPHTAEEAIMFTFIVRDS